LKTLTWLALKGHYYRRSAAV